MAFGPAAGARPPACARGGPAAGVTMMPLLVPVLLVPVPVVLLVLLVLLVPPWRCGCRGGPAAGVAMTARLPRQCSRGGPAAGMRLQK